MAIVESFEYEEVSGFKFGEKQAGIPTMFSHIYYVDGLLIDTGQSRARKTVVDTAENLAVDQIFLTHHHEDHTGNIEPLRAMYGCEVYAPKLCCQMMKKPPKLSLAQKLTWGDRPAQHNLSPLDSKLKTKSFSFELIPIPGHAPDMVALYEPERKWLFSADLFINSYIGYFIRDESMRDQINSIKRILELDFKVMFCSHNPQLINAKEKLAKKLNFLESFFNDVAALHQKGLSEKEVFKSLKLKENWPVRLLSGGSLSKMNMVRSVIRDLEG